MWQTLRLTCTLLLAWIIFNPSMAKVLNPWYSTGSIIYPFPDWGHICIYIYMNIHIISGGWMGQGGGWGVGGWGGGVGGGGGGGGVGGGGGGGGGGQGGCCGEKSWTWSPNSMTSHENGPQKSGEVKSLMKRKHNYAKVVKFVAEFSSSWAVGCHCGDAKLLELLITSTAHTILPKSHPMNTVYNAASKR